MNGDVQHVRQQSLLRLGKYGTCCMISQNEFNALRILSFERLNVIGFFFRKYKS